MSLLSPSVVAAIDDLEVAARVVVEGLRVGAHRSPFHGYGAEFQQYRPYRAGDDLKYLDWKMYARSDRLFTRQFRETTNLSMMLVLDASASMGFPVAGQRAGVTEGGVSKLRYASILAASLAYLVVEQGNAVGLMTHDGSEWSYLPARTGRAHLRALLARLDRATARDRWNGAALLRRSAELLQRRGLVLVLSDFYDDEADVRGELRQIVQRGHDVAMLQVLSPSEGELPADEPVELEDAETGERRLVHPASIAGEYRRNMAAFIERSRSGASASGIDYALMTTDVPPQRALREYLVQRRS